MILKLELKTFLLVQFCISAPALHVSNRTLGPSEHLVTLDVLGSGRESIVVDLQDDNHINLEENINKVEPHECPPCLCLLDNARD